jgi:hypothetical protein
LSNRIKKYFYEIIPLANKLIQYVQVEKIGVKVIDEI